MISESSSLSLCPKGTVTLRFCHDTHTGQKPMQKYQDSSLSPEERASDLLARMNLDEKFGQIQCYNAIDSFLGKSVEKQNPYGVGQVCILIATILHDDGDSE